MQPGGEDQVLAAETCILENHKHHIFHFTKNNHLIKNLNPIKLACITLWNKIAADELLDVIQKIRPDIVHFHNTFPLISPSAYYAAKSEGVPVVQTLHNFRLLCPNALFFRNGHVCEDCLGKFVAWPGILHACYRDSRTATTVAAFMLSLHRLLRSYSKIVDLFIALTETSRSKFILGGLPAEKVVVKPNFVDNENYSPRCQKSIRRYALFVGRLSPEKGIEVLLKAWKLIGKRLPLKIVGTGPMENLIKNKVKSLPGVECAGRLQREQILALMRQAKLLVFPSIWFESFGMTIVEAFSTGLPVIASRLGAMAELVKDGRNGLHFEPGNPEDLVSKVEWALTHPNEMAELGKAARKDYEMRYLPDLNYRMLMDIYETAIERARTRN
jgi:glycosyltransferase involved in cell wall biosynthesis